MHAKSLQSCLTLCDPMDCSLPVPLSMGFSQAKILVWATMPFSRDLPDPGMEAWDLMSPALAGGFFTTQSGIAESFGNFIFNCLRKQHTVFHPGCTILLPH